MTNNKKQLYRVILKILTFIGVGTLSYFFIKSAIMPLERQSIASQEKPITIDLATIPLGKMITVQWSHNNIAVLHRPKEMQNTLPENTTNREYFIFVNSGGDVNCPLTIDSKTKIHLKDICSNYLYDGSGKAIKNSNKAQNLVIPPYHITGNQLIIGQN